MKVLTCLNDEMRSAYPSPMEEAEIALLTDNPLGHVKELSKKYDRRIQRVVAQIGADLSSCRWMALVYRSAVLEKFIFNQSHSLLPQAESLRFRKLQRPVFRWYENRAEAGELLSLFQIALSAKYVIAHCPYFGFTRMVTASRDKRLYNLDALFPGLFVDHYNNVMWKAVAGSPRGDVFRRVDHIVNTAINAILSTRVGSEEATKLKYTLAEITGNSEVIRHENRELLTAIFCLVVVDPGWRYYYYIPYAHSGEPYAALGVASSRPYRIRELHPANSANCLFRPLEIIEQALLKKSERAEKAWGDVVDKLVKSCDWDHYLIELTNLLRSKRGVEVVVRHRPATTTAMPDWELVPLGKSNASILVRCFLKDTQPREIPTAIHLLSDTIKKNGGDIGIDAPFDAEWLALGGWLDVDLIASTRIFAEVGAKSPTDCYLLMALLNDYFERRILRNGALKVNQTPDGWMCGFSTIEQAIRAAVELVRNLGDDLNSKLRKDHPRIYSATRDGIGLRIGVHSDQVHVRRSEPLSEKQDDALNHTGHLQKQGGEIFLKKMVKLDLDRPDAGRDKEKLAWVLALSSTAIDALFSLKSRRDGSAKWLARQPIRTDSSVDGRAARVFGAFKKTKNLFDVLDERMKVGSVICSGSVRTYPYIKNEARSVLSVVDTCYKAGDSDSAAPAPPRSCLDIGSGSGLYAMYLSRKFPNAEVVAIEPDDDSCRTWKRNRRSLGISQKKCTLIAKSFQACRSSLSKQWDLVVFNLPYVPTPKGSSAFLHSNGGPDGLAIVRHVLNWLDSNEVLVRKCVFPIYSLAKDDTFETTLISDELRKRANIRTRYGRIYTNPLIPNWFVLGYSGDPQAKFVSLAQAFPEARRQPRVANWLYKLREKGWKYMCHTIVEMTWID